MVRTPGPAIAVEALGLLGCMIGALVAGPAWAAPAGQGSAPAATPPPQDAEVADAPELDDASYRDLVTDAQRLLKLRGFDPGPLDGQIGLRTRRAIRAYQAAARSRGVLEALKGPPPLEANASDPAARPELVRLGPADPAASD